MRTPGLAQVHPDGELTAPRLLADRHDEFAHARTQVAFRLHQLLLQLIPGAAPRFLSALQAKALLATVRPRDIAGRTRRQAAELITEISVLNRKLKASDKQLRQLVAATGTGLLDLYGIGPAGAARLLGDIGDIARFAGGVRREAGRAAVARLAARRGSRLMSACHFAAGGREEAVGRVRRRSPATDDRQYRRRNPAREQAHV